MVATEDGLTGAFDVQGIYMLPTEEGMPPRAILMDNPDPDDGPVVSGILAVFSNDMGCWTLNGTPLPQGLSDAISAHAAQLAIPGFTPTEE